MFLYLQYFFFVLILLLMCDLVAMYLLVFNKKFNLIWFTIIVIILSFEKKCVVIILHCIALISIALISTQAL